MRIQFESQTEKISRLTGIAVGLLHAHGTERQRDPDQPATVAQANNLLAKVYGKGQFILQRGNGYYYFRGEHALAQQVESIYVYRVSHLTQLELSTDVLYLVTKALDDFTRYGA